MTDPQYKNTTLIVCSTLCKSGKFETGEGTCALICMGQLGEARRNCQYIYSVHKKLAEEIVKALETVYGPIV